MVENKREGRLDLPLWIMSGSKHKSCKKFRELKSNIILFKGDK